MTSKQHYPDPLAVLLSHALVGALAAGIVGSKAGPQAAIMAAVVVMAAHRYFDAPLAQMLAELGA